MCSCFLYSYKACYIHTLKQNMYLFQLIFNSHTCYFFLHERKSLWNYEALIYISDHVTSSLQNFSSYTSCFIVYFYFFCFYCYYYFLWYSCVGIGTPTFALLFLFPMIPYHYFYPYYFKYCFSATVRSLLICYVIVSWYSTIIGNDEKSCILLSRYI